MKTERLNTFDVRETRAALEAVQQEAEDAYNATIEALGHYASVNSSLKYISRGIQYDAETKTFDRPVFSIRENGKLEPTPDTEEPKTTASQQALMDIAIRAGYITPKPETVTSE